MLTAWHPQRVLIENAHHGPPLAAELKDFSTQLVNPRFAKPGGGAVSGKVERATTLLDKLEKGQIFLPRFENGWLPDLENEWLAWTGLDGEPSDQIDAASYAALYDHKASSTKMTMWYEYYPSGPFFARRYRHLVW